MKRRAPAAACRLDLGLIPYGPAWKLQKDLVARKISEAAFPEMLLLLEHPPVFTLGRWGRPEDILIDGGQLREVPIEVARCERGGQVTYHGPGQLVLYPILNLKKLGWGIRDCVTGLEEVVIRTLADYQVRAERLPESPGVWVGSEKIASLGLAVQKGISYHGVALNYGGDLTPFDWIHPCGQRGLRMTSLGRHRGGPVADGPLRGRLADHFAEVFHCRWVAGDSLPALDGAGLEIAKKYPYHHDDAARDPVQTASGNDSAAVPGWIASKRNRYPAREPKPAWLKKRIAGGPNILRVKELVEQGGLHTVCREARCPNQGECYSRGTATFLLLGDRCTRGCRFCAVNPGQPEPPDPGEPERVAGAVERLGLSYAVLTSVTRDDLPDGGAGHFKDTVLAVRGRGKVRVECLIPDFQGSPAALSRLSEARPEVINHNLETVPRLYPRVRPGSDYERSLSIFWSLKQLFPGILTKSGIMVGLGEQAAEVLSLFQDLREKGCEVLTIGQYLQPSPRHHPVRRYVPPEEFAVFKEEALARGFKAVAAGPYVRSSYRAEALYRTATGA